MNHLIAKLTEEGYDIIEWVNVDGAILPITKKSNSEANGGNHPQDGNPVPSLDKIIELLNDQSCNIEDLGGTFILDEYWQNWFKVEGYQDEDIECYPKVVLKNGRTTDKENPKGKWIFIEYAEEHNRNLLKVTYHTNFNNMKNFSASQSNYYKEKFPNYNSVYYKVL